jgi:hypothetical protein
MLGKVADFFEQEVDEAVDALSSLMEPHDHGHPGRPHRRHRDRHVPADLQDGPGGLSDYLALLQASPFWLGVTVAVVGPVQSARSLTSSSIASRR